MSNRIGRHYDRYNTQSYTEFNRTNFHQNSYKDVYSSSNNQQLSTSQEPEIEYEEVEYFLTISSKDRDSTLYPNVNHYNVSFPKEFKNITSIELIQGIIPDKNNITHEPYLLLRIEELEDVMVSFNRQISDSFAMLQLAPAVSNGRFINLDKRIYENTVKFFKTPKASLTKMTVTITDSDGIPFDFGTDVIGSPQKSLQNTFIFRLVCLEKKRTQIRHRNVF
jgi:hypothetical protein